MSPKCLLKTKLFADMFFTFQLADFRLTVRPLLVTVHFILMKKSRSVLSSFPFLAKLLPVKVRQTWSQCVTVVPQSLTNVLCNFQIS